MTTLHSLLDSYRQPDSNFEGKNNHPSPTHELFDSIMKDDKSIGRFKEFFSIFKS